MMRTRSDHLFAVALALTLFGCSSSDNPTSPGTDSVGGADATGGATAQDETPTGGGSTLDNTYTGGRAATGGSNATGGSGDTGGRSVVGGAFATGGSLATGGTQATAGTKANGGTKAIGGTRATGGSSAISVTGGATATGTSATGGAVPAGGSKAFGGSKATGGTLPAGGTAASGGTTAAAGSKSTGGSTTVTTVQKFVGNITTGNSVDPSGLTYSKYWDQITPENQGKWGSVQSTPTSAFNWGSLDTIYAYATKNNVVFKQHTFVWGPQQPSPASSITVAQVEAWIKAFCERYTETKLIDVVNEPPPHQTPGYTAALGAGESGSYPWITKAFKLARQHCPSAILILNDYNNIENGDEDRFINIVKDIKANGAPIDAVGAQSHGLKGMSGSSVKANLDKLNSQTGLPVYITEFDINDANDSSQSNSFQTFIPIFLDASYVHGITVWGWIAGRTWETNSGIVNGTTPRAAMTWLMQKLGRPVPPN